MAVIMAKQYLFGEYVITGIPNAFNNKVGWWISKDGIAKSLYCFSTSGTTTDQKKELEYQLSHMDGYIRMFDQEILFEGGE